MTKQTRKGILPFILNGVVFIDLTKAFDTIDHEIILRKMSYLGVDQAAIKWFSSYLSGRTQRCNVSGKLSSARTLSCGVPQGSILGPLLFLIYINDLPNSLRGAVPRMFADDTNLTLSAKTLTELKLALTPELNNLSCWLKANKLSLNVAKTELMIIGSRQRLSAQCDDVEIRIDDQIIKRVDHTKSLGLTIDAQLSWGKHVEEICKPRKSLELLVCYTAVFWRKCIFVKLLPESLLNRISLLPYPAFTLNQVKLMLIILFKPIAYS